MQNNGNAIDSIDDESIDVQLTKNDASSFLNQTEKLLSEQFRDSNMIEFMRRKSFSEVSRRKHINNYRRNIKNNNNN